MDILDYKPNSHKSKEERESGEEVRKVEKVVKGPVKVKKTSKLNKDIREVKDFAVKELVIPSLKETLFAIIKECAQRLIWRGADGPSDRKRSTAEKVSYRSYYDRDEDRFSSSRHRSRFDYDELIFRDYGEADAVLDRMSESIKKYRFVTVADMYDMADITPEHTMYNYGWDDISRAEIRRASGGGYIIDLPRAIPRER